MEKKMIQLQSILSPSKSICDIPEMYYHKKDYRIDFNGYFNYFAIEKRKKYTKIENLKLSLRVRGYSELIIVHDGIDLKTFDLEEDHLKEYLVDLPYKEYENGVFWFALKESGNPNECQINGFYLTDFNQAYYDVNIGIDICTFKRELYVKRNLEQLINVVFKNNELNVSEHVELYIIDNGNTLQDYEPICNLIKDYSDRVRVIPNKNSGGAGGFTRGMIEILEHKKTKNFTHIMLMDDDAIIEPDILVRVYGFLSTINEDWRDITVGGSMLREDYPYIQFCSGEWWESGNIINPQTHLDLRSLKVAACNCLTAAVHEYDRYSGWWCCCYSLNVVREDNLPIPLFIHHDDIEFGLRNSRYGCVFLNGVGVWHRGAKVAFPGAYTYYDIRNNLIEIALHQKRNKKKTAWKVLSKTIILAAVRLRYEDAMLAYQAMLDFFKGPKWLYSQEPDALNSEIRNMARQMYSLEELNKYISKPEFQSVDEQIQQYLDSFDMKVLDDSIRKRDRVNLIKILSFNGWLLPAAHDKIKVIFTTDSPYETFRKKKIVLYEPASGKVSLSEKRYCELLKIVKIFVNAFVLMERHFNTAANSYQKNINKITNKKAWKEYLNIE